MSHRGPPAEASSMAGAHAAGSTPRPCQLLVIPVDMPPEWLRGMASKSDAGAYNLWMLLAPKEAPLVTVTLLLAALMVDDAQQMLRPATMPDGPASVVLPADGELRSGRGKRLAPWALEEIARVAGMLRATHADYVAAVTAALCGEGELFRPPPADFVLSDASGFSRVGPAPPAVAVDLSQSEAVRLGLAPLDVVGADYGRNRYMRTLSEADFSRRTADIIANMHVVDADGRVALDPRDPRYNVWLMYLAEVAAEKKLRYGSDMATWPPEARRPFDRSQLPGSLRPEVLARHKRLRPASPLPATYVVKYGRRRHLEDAYHDGKVRVNPASTYRDPSLNAAQRDDERVAELHVDPAPFAAFGSLLDLAGAAQGQRYTVRHELNTNYYVFCTAATLSTRLLLDFEADAALVIREADAFFARLDAAVRRAIPGWPATRVTVTYYDPLQVTPDAVRVGRWKHFRYAYQHEVRMLWMPPAPAINLAPLDLVLGPLGDVAELLV